MVGLEGITVEERLTISLLNIEEESAMLCCTTRKHIGSYCRESRWERHCWNQESQELLDWSWGLSHSLQSSRRRPRSLTVEEWKRRGNPSETSCWSFEYNLEIKRKRLVRFELQYRLNWSGTTMYSSFCSPWLLCPGSPMLTPNWEGYEPRPMTLPWAGELGSACSWLWGRGTL